MIEIFGIHTGLQPDLLFSGAAGGWLAMTYQQRLTLISRVNRLVLSSLTSAWGTPLTVAIANLPHDLEIVKYPFAFIIGLLTMDVLGGGIISIAKKWIGNHGQSD